jgi:hypothetical protein
MSARKGLTRTACYWGVYWEGTAEQLVEGGVLTADQAAAVLVPSGHGRRRPPIVLASGRTATVCKALGRRHAWAVREEFTPAEQVEGERLAAQVKAVRRAHLEGDPQVIRRVARALLEEGIGGIACAFNLIDGDPPTRPYHFDADTVQAAWSAVRELVRVFEQGSITLTPRAQPSDAQFERFLQAALPKGAP